MKRHLWTALIGGVASGFVALASGAATARDFTVVSWGGNYQDAQREIYFKPFADTAKMPLKDETWDGGIGVIAAKVKAGTPNWDAVQVESEELALGCADGFYEKLDWSKRATASSLLSISRLYPSSPEKRRFGSAPTASPPAWATSGK